MIPAALNVTFLTPLAGIVAFAAIIPLVAFARSERRVAKVRSLLRLAPPGGSPRVAVGAIAAVALLVAIGAAQPVLERRTERSARTDAQVFFALDTSRSMLASQGRDEPTRFERAVVAARRMRAALSRVPVGIASLSDRVLPHLFPSPNEQSFDGVLAHSIGIDRPGSDSAGERIASDLEATSTFASGNFFRGSQRRLLVIFTDAETSSNGGAALRQALADAHIRTILLRIWAPGERIYTRSGIESGYEPDPSSAAAAAEYARVTNGQAFDEDDLDGAIGAARTVLGGPQSYVRAESVDIRPLGPFIFLAALLPLSLLLWQRNFT